MALNERRNSMNSIAVINNRAPASVVVSPATMNLMRVSPKRT